MHCTPNVLVFPWCTNFPLTNCKKYIWVSSLIQFLGLDLVQFTPNSSATLENKGSKSKRSAPSYVPLSIQHFYLSILSTLHFVSCLDLKRMCYCVPFFINFRSWPKLMLLYTLDFISILTFSTFEGWLERIPFFGLYPFEVCVVVWWT